MVRYCLAAAALKFFSSTKATRRLYREVLGNRYGSRRRTRTGLTPAYVDQAAALLGLVRKYDAIRDGMSLLEVGTGWIHFYSVFLRLFYDVRITLVDAWDNRQLPPLKSCFAQLEAVLDSSFHPGPEASARARSVLQAIQRAGSFEELYAALGFTYVLDPTLDSLPSESHDLIYSFHVLEHIAAGAVERHLRNMQRILRPGGFQIHQLGLDDHLAHYDRAVHSKNYMRYSRRTWRLFFENDVQYFNRILRSEWLRMFAETGMTLRQESAERCDPANVRVHPEFGAVAAEDLACVIPTFVFERQPQAALAAGDPRHAS